MNSIYSEEPKGSFFFKTACLLFLSLNSLSVFSQENSSSGIPFSYEAYVDIETNEPDVQVFKEPGLNWRTCTRFKDPKTKKESCYETIGYLNRNSELTVLETPVTRKSRDPFTDEEIDVDYVKVKYSSEKIINGVKTTVENFGYIEAGRVRRIDANNKKLNSIYSENDKSTPGKGCPPGKETPIKQKNKWALKEYSEKISKWGVNEAANAVQKHVGQCVKKPIFIGRGLAYDNLIMPELRKEKKFPRVIKEDGAELTQQDLIGIDAVARTVFGEIRGCFKNGLQYPMAQTKLLANRTNAISNPSYRKLFIQGEHANDKPDIAKVATTPSQFNVWMKDNATLPAILCPPKTSDTKLPNGRKADPESIAVWNNAVKIATEAVLFPKAFKKRTSEVTQMHGTSNMDKFYNFSKVFPSVLGRPVNNGKCLQIWQ